MHLFEHAAEALTPPTGGVSCFRTDNCCPTGENYTRHCDLILRAIRAELSLAGKQVGKTLLCEVSLALWVCKQTNRQTNSTAATF